ncbi:hypothetical protein HKD37_17G048637 [Glycine soja]
MLLMRNPSGYQTVESGVGSEGIIPKLLHCGAASEVAPTKPFENVAPLIGLASAKGHTIMHWLKGKWTNEHKENFIQVQFFNHFRKTQFSPIPFPTTSESTSPPKTPSFTIVSKSRI